MGAPNVMEYGTDSVAVVLEWIQALKNGVSQSVDAVPQVNITSLTNTSVHLQVLYNIFYNVSVKFSVCGQSNTTTFVIFNISEFICQRFIPA